MLGYGLFTPASVYFVNESVPEADRVRGQTVMMVASNGMGGMLGGVLAGWTLDLGGANLMLAACVASASRARPPPFWTPRGPEIRIKTLPTAP